MLGDVSAILVKPESILYRRKAIIFGWGEYYPKRGINDEKKAVSCTIVIEWIQLGAHLSKDFEVVWKHLYIISHAQCRRGCRLGIHIRFLNVLYGEL